MFLQESPTEQKDSIQKFYDKLSPHFKNLWGPHLHDGYYLTGNETRERAQEQLVEFLASKAQIPEGSRVLDVGCGLGATSVWLAENLKCRPTGITLSSVQVQMAKELAAEKGVEAEFFVQDAESLSFDQSFDAIWMVGVLGHLPDQEGFARKASTLLRSGGRYLLADWTLGDSVSESDYQKIVAPTIKGMMMPTIVPASDYTRWLSETGFKIIESHDITEETSKTWEQSVEIVKAPKIVSLALSLGTEVVDLVTAIYHMRKAMKKGLIRYSVLVAEKV